MFSELLTGIARSLKEHDIPYMVMGGQAVLVHGEPRMTRDIDITLGVGIEGEAKVRELALDLGLRPLADEAFTAQTMVFPCAQDSTGIRVDFIYSWSLYEREAISRALAIPVLGVAVQFASVEDLIIQKVVAGRGRDKEDVCSILAKNASCDLDTIRHWLGLFSESLSEPYLQRFELWLQDVQR